MAKLGILVGLGAGYVLGARAGRQRYEQIRSRAQGVWRDPRVQRQAHAAQDVVQEKAAQAAGTVQETAAHAAGAVQAKATHVAGNVRDVVNDKVASVRSDSTDTGDSNTAQTG